MLRKKKHTHKMAAVQDAVVPATPEVPLYLERRSGASSAERCSVLTRYATRCDAVLRSAGVTEAYRSKIIFTYTALIVVAVYKFLLVPYLLEPSDTSDASAPDYLPPVAASGVSFHAQLATMLVVSRMLQMGQMAGNRDQS